MSRYFPVSGTWLSEDGSWSRTLTARRRAVGLSQTEVAALMGTSQSAVARLEAGHNDVRISTLERYAAALDQRLEWRLALGPDRTRMNMDPNGSWLEERLFERRIVLCRGVLDDALAGRVAAELMTLDALGDGAVELQLDSEGASLEAAWTLIDVIDLLGVPVNIVCSGRVEGAAVGLLTCRRAEDCACRTLGFA